MRRVISNIAYAILWLLFILVAGLSLYWRLTNPDVTETRIFLTHAREIAALLGAILIFGSLHAATRDP